jgi:hypothetical protein
MGIKYSKWSLNRPNDRCKIYQHLPLQDRPKFTQTGIFGLKLFHLATPVLRFCKSNVQRRGGKFEHKHKLAVSQ